MMRGKESYAPLLIRLPLGTLFVAEGILKFLNPTMIIKILGDIGFPTPTFFGWLLLLSEFFFGLAVLLGYKVKYTAWPLAIILAVAILTVHLKTIGTLIGFVNVMLHLSALTSLIALSLLGPGCYAVSKE